MPIQEPRAGSKGVTAAKLRSVRPLWIADSVQPGNVALQFDEIHSEVTHVPRSDNGILFNLADQILSALHSALNKRVSNWASGSPGA